MRFSIFFEKFYAPKITYIPSHHQLHAIRSRTPTNKIVPTIQIFGNRRLNPSDSDRYRRGKFTLLHSAGRVSVNTAHRTKRDYETAHMQSTMEMIGNLKVQRVGRCQDSALKCTNETKLLPYLRIPVRTNEGMRGQQTQSKGDGIQQSRRGRVENTFRVRRGLAACAAPEFSPGPGTFGRRGAVAVVRHGFLSQVKLG